MRIISKDVLIATFSTVVGLVIGGVIGYGISNHFYELGKKEITKDLINSAITELAHNTLKENFPQLYDSVAYLSSGTPWRKLAASGVDRLYFNILSFRHYQKFEEFVDMVNSVKLATDDFNDRITLRNNCLLLGQAYVTPHNPKAFHYYQWVVCPKLLSLLDYLKLNYNQLTK